MLVAHALTKGEERLKLNECIQVEVTYVFFFGQKRDFDLMKENRMKILLLFLEVQV